MEAALIKYVNKQFPCQVILVARTHEQVSSSKSWYDLLLNQLLVKEKLTIFSRTYEQIKLVKENLLVCTGLYST